MRRVLEIFQNRQMDRSGQRGLCLRLRHRSAPLSREGGSTDHSGGRPDLAGQSNIGARHHSCETVPDFHRLRLSALAERLLSAPPIGTTAGLENSYQCAKRPGTQQPSPTAGAPFEPAIRSPGAIRGGYSTTTSPAVKFSRHLSQNGQINPLHS